MRRAERPSRIALEALALGLLHGPAELVPVSSSGHVAALPWLLTWEVAGWDAARRKELEVALHAGTAAALLAVLRRERMRPALRAAAVAPPALAGL
ncbi:MAG: undecaprenyl-diphosphate phosphatase, partial [Solirubrobacteraceae bacterium]